MIRYLMVDFWKDWWAAWRQMRRIESEIDRIKEAAGVEDTFFEKGGTVFGVTLEWQAPTWWVKWGGK